MRRLVFGCLKVDRIQLCFANWNAMPLAADANSAIPVLVNFALRIQGRTSLFNHTQMPHLRSIYAYGFINGCPNRARNAYWANTPIRQGVDRNIPRPPRPTMHGHLSFEDRPSVCPSLTTGRCWWRVEGGDRRRLWLRVARQETLEALGGLSCNINEMKWNLKGATSRHISLRMLSTPRKPSAARQTPNELHLQNCNKLTCGYFAQIWPPAHLAASAENQTNAFAWCWQV